MSEEQTPYEAGELSVAEHLPEPATDPRPWLFKPGQVANPYGRKGNPEKRTMVTELRRKADRKASQLADALVKTALTGNVRAFVAIRDTAYGVPAQKLVVEQADNPAAELLAGLLAARQVPVSPMRELPSGESDIATEP